MVPYDNFVPFPCMESHGIIWFHAWNRMEVYNLGMKLDGIIWKTKETTVMTSEKIENKRIRSKTTGRASRKRYKITVRTTGTSPKKKRKSYPKKSDSVPNYKHSLQKLKTQVLLPNSLEALRFSGFIVSFSLFKFKSNQIQLFSSCFQKVTRK